MGKHKPGGNAGGAREKAGRKKKPRIGISFSFNQSSRDQAVVEENPSASAADGGMEIDQHVLDDQVIEPEGDTELSRDIEPYDEELMNDDDEDDEMDENGTSQGSVDDSLDDLSIPIPQGYLREYLDLFYENFRKKFKANTLSLADTLWTRAPVAVVSSSSDEIVSPNRFYAKDVFLWIPSMFGTSIKCPKCS